MESVEEGVQPEWVCIIKITDKISDVVDTIDEGWPELVEMVCSISIEERKRGATPEEMFFNLYSFLFRLYYRIKTNPHKRPFNITSYHEGKQTFWIQNYDYTTFKWAKQNGFDDSISNDIIEIQESKLNTKQLAALHAKCRTKEVI